MRRPKKPSLGKALKSRTIPVPIASDDPGRGRRGHQPIEPGLSTLIADLRPPAAGSISASWTSWAAHDQEDYLLTGSWETPEIDGEPWSGGGIGFPEPEVETPPIAVGDIMTAGEAGWAPLEPATPRSWLGAMADIGRTSPAAPAPDDPAVFDHHDFNARVERGAAFATTEAQLQILAERALQRLSPRGNSRWLAATPDGQLATHLCVGGSNQVACTIRATAACPAMNERRVQRFDATTGLDSCPHLLASEGRNAAVICVPVPGESRWHGVVQIATDAEEPLDVVRAAVLERTIQTLSERLEMLPARD